MSKTTLEPDGVLANGQPGFSESSVVATAVAMQEAGGAWASGMSKTPRQRAQDAIREIADTAAKCGVVATTMAEATKRLSAQADQTKDKAIQAAEKIRVAYDRLNKVEVEKIERHAAAAERLVTALEQLAALSVDGRLERILGAIRP